MRHLRNRHNAQGASVIELMVGLLILGIITAGIFAQLNAATQRIATEQVKVDNFDEARDFVDQFFRDINQIGYPNGHIVSFTQGVPLATAQAFPGVAIGLVQIGPQSIWFEGDIDGTGVVQEVQYQINGSGTCGLCFQRSAVPKQAGDPVGATPAAGADWGTEVNDLITPTIFTYFDANGNQLPVTAVNTLGANAAVLAQVKTIHISLTIQNNQVMDPKTGQPIQTSFEGEVSLNNCSMAASGYNPMSCF